MLHFEDSRTVFEETMNPNPGYLPDQSPAPATSTLPPYEFTLGDNHDTLPAEDAPCVVPEISLVQKIVAQQVELPADLPEDN